MLSDIHHLNVSSPYPDASLIPEGDLMLAISVMSPTATAIFRAGDLKDRSTFFRNDLVRLAGIPGAQTNPHTFLTNIGATPPIAALAIAAQQQIAIFFESDGTVVIDPDGAGPFFEVPIAGDLPEDLGF